MRPNRAGIRAVTFLSAALCFRASLDAQERPAAVSEPAVPPADEIVVLGKAIEELRVRIERAEDDVYTRFNEINSDDSHDIHCYERAPAGTRIVKRVCLSNAARAADLAIAQATVRALQGPTVAGADGTTGAGVSAAPGGDTVISQYEHAKQLDTERRIQNELRELAHDDPALEAAVVRLGDAYRALDVVAGARPGETLYAELNAGEKEMPFGARHLFEVRVGAVAWIHPLKSRTFTLGNVQGRIRDLRVDCDKGATTVDYKEDAEWTIPESWGPCRLEVGAKRGTTFALYEFE